MHMTRWIKGPKWTKKPRERTKREKKEGCAKKLKTRTEGTIKGTGAKSYDKIRLRKRSLRSQKPAEAELSETSRSMTSSHEDSPLGECTMRRRQNRGYWERRSPKRCMSSKNSGKVGQGGAMSGTEVTAGPLPRWLVIELGTLDSGCLP